MGDSSTKSEVGPAPTSPIAQEGGSPDSGESFWPTMSIFFVLVLLLIPALWGVFPNWYIRLAGTEAPGRAAYVDDCQDDGPTYKTSVIFQDAQGQLHEIPGDTCTNFYQDGEQLSVWYLPNDPTSTLIGGGNAEFLTFLTGFWLVFTLLLLLFFGIMVWELRKASVREEDFSTFWRLILCCLLILAPVLVAVLLYPPSTPNPKIGPARDFHPGETVSVAGRWAVTVQGVQVASASAGSLCLEIDITLSNTTPQPLSFDVRQFTLYDAQEQALTTSCSIDATKLANVSLAPGQVIQGALAYRVAASLRQSYLAFQPDPDNATNVGRSFWRLKLSS